MIRKHCLLAAIAIVIASTGALAGDPATDQLQSRIQSLKARVGELENNQAVQTAQVSDAINNVLRDAERHSRMLSVAPEGNSGWDDGFYIRSANGDFTMRPGFQMQLRNVTDWRVDAKNGDQDDVTNGFELRRLRFDIFGNAFGPDNTFYVQWDTNRNGGAVTLLDLWVRHKCCDDWFVKGGQYKQPAFHEENISDKTQMCVEKSILNDILGGGNTNRVQGASIIYGGYARNENPVYAEIIFHDGANSLNTDFTDNGGQHFGVGGRFEYKIMGDWRQYTNDFTTHGVQNDLLVLGVGGDVTDRDNQVQYLGTVDAEYKNKMGWCAYAAFLCQNLDVRNVPGGDDTFNWGVLAQLGYDLNPQTQVFVRYDLTHFEDAQANGKKNLHEINAGINYFFGPNGAYGHHVKLTIDVGYLPNGAGAAFLKEDVQGGSRKTELYLRAQLNFYI